MKKGIREFVSISSCLVVCAGTAMHVFLFGCFSYKNSSSEILKIHLRIASQTIIYMSTLSFFSSCKIGNREDLCKILHDIDRKWQTGNIV